MGELLLKLGFVRTNEVYELFDVKDNAIICKIWQIVDNTESDIVSNYIKESLSAEPYSDYIKVSLKNDRFSVQFKNNSSETNHEMDISYFIPIFSGVLSDKRNEKLNTILK
jgi:hypothetical protein